MATVGLGRCNTEGPNFGPECADPNFLDSHDCPKDQILSGGYWSQPWFGVPYFKGATPRNRFTYDAGTGKCWDYTDCYCTGCGEVFKSHAQDGYGFTGFGYYNNHVWFPFPKPLDQMSGTEKAHQCSIAIDAVRGDGSCDPADVNLVCFNAGGYPKQSCQDTCAAKGGAYTHTNHSHHNKT